MISTPDDGTARFLFYDGDSDAYNVGFSCGAAFSRIVQPGKNHQRDPKTGPCWQNEDQSHDELNHGQSSTLRIPSRETQQMGRARDPVPMSSHR
jgi:hypothetical protein